MRTLWLSILSTAIGLFVFSPRDLSTDLKWCAFIALWVAGAGLVKWPRRTIATVAVVALGFGLSHANGFKIYGSPALYDNRPLLMSGFELEAFEAPNVLVAADGSRHELRGVKFTPEVLELPPAKQRRRFDPSGGPIRFATDDRAPGGFVFEAAIWYGCGNVWDPHYFPKRLPRYTITNGVTALWNLSEHPEAVVKGRR